MNWKHLQPKQKLKIYHWLFTYIIVGVLFMGIVATKMLMVRDETDQQYNSALTENAHSLEMKQKRSKNAVEVTTGTFVESIKEISIRSSSFRVSFEVWFRWEGHDNLTFLPENSFRIYNGIINKWEPIKSRLNDGIHYEKLRIDASITKSFRTTRFPLGSHVLEFYILPTQYDINQVLLVPDKVHSDVNENLSISGYNLLSHTVNDYVYAYPNNFNHPDSSMPRTYSEFVTVLKVNQEGFGLYIRCFIALLGTTVWALMSLYTCSSHYVNPLSTMATTLFGTVSNMMICTNLQPDVVTIGLAEYINAWGILTILAVTIGIIQVNYIRDTRHERAFSRKFGRMLFWTILVLTLAGHIIMPISAWVR